MSLKSSDLAAEGLLCSQLLTIRGSLIFEPSVRIYGRVCVSNCQIGANSYINENSNVSNARIGRYCSIGSNVNIGLLKHPIDWVTTSSFTYENIGLAPHWKQSPINLSFSNNSSLVIIEDDVWIGFGVTVAASKPINIGRGCIIAAGSILTQDVQPYSIVGGNPAKHIKYRFSKDVIDELQASGWWYYDHVRFALENPHFTVCWDDPKSFLKWWGDEGRISLDKFRFTNSYKIISFT